MTPKKQILIVEDNVLNREMLVEILADRYAILQAENGREALEILKQNKDSISLILLDVMMPVMNGYDFLDRIKEDAELSLIPVIVTTQSGSENDEIAALQHGATDFVPKPYRPQILLHRLNSLIKLRETASMANQFQYDRLTGLYSKEFFCQKIRERLLENPEQEYSIICSNIENFKLFNDIFGFQEGDRLLKEVASIARNMVDSTGFCGRFAADRFLCFQEREREQTDRRNFYSVLNKKFSPHMKNIVMRWGIYEIDDRSISVEQMCDRAQLAACSIKGQYNQFFAVYNDSLRSKLLREKAITDAMETALAENQFAVYLQPKYSLKDECMVGAEALVRWNHPEWGFMSPGEFIPLFAKNGFIFKMDQYVWERVCCLLCDWRKKGRSLIPISVNVCRTDLYQPNFVDNLLELTQKYGIDPAYLHLEITEGVYSENSHQVISVVEELHKQGFAIEMDDFGSGYSSLNMLSQMELDILKLDMQFIKNEIAKPAHQSILSDIIVMAHKMHLSVVAEGVETREQMQRLQSVGCDYVQGYFFAKPMPAAEFEALWQKQYCRSAESSVQTFQNKPALRSLLVADEDAGYRQLVRETFWEEYRVLEASDGDHALDCIMANCNNGVAAIILSMSLPNHGTATLLKALRQNPALWKIPVLATIPSGEKSEKSEEMLLAQETDDFLCKRHPMFDLHRRVQRLADIAEFRKQAKFLQDAANRDYLTGLLNRRGFHDSIESLRAEDLPLAVCLFDLDNLKDANDAYGHDAGDRIIRAFADLLRRNTENKDVLCRYGGDEFIVILKRLDHPEAVHEKGEKICWLFQECFVNEPFTASCSGGIVLCTTDEKLSDNLLEQADQALYQAKRENKGGCYMWKDRETSSSAQSSN